MGISRFPHMGTPTNPKFEDDHDSELMQINFISLIFSMYLLMICIAYLCQSIKSIFTTKKPIHSLPEYMSLKTMPLFRPCNIGKTLRIVITHYTRWGYLHMEMSNSNLISFIRSHVLPYLGEKH